MQEQMPWCTSHVAQSMLKQKSRRNVSLLVMKACLVQHQSHPYQSTHPEEHKANLVTGKASTVMTLQPQMKCTTEWKCLFCKVYPIQ